MRQSDSRYMARHNEKLAAALVELKQLYHRLPPWPPQWRLFQGATWRLLFGSVRIK